MNSKKLERLTWKRDRHMVTALHFLEIEREDIADEHALEAMKLHKQICDLKKVRKQ